MKTVKEIVQKRLGELNMTNRRFAEMLGINQPSLNKIYERNSTSIETLEKMATTLGLSISAFFEENESLKLPKGYTMIEESELLRLKEVEVKYLTDKLEEQKKNAG